MHLIVGGDSTIGAGLSQFWRDRGIPHHASTRRVALVSALRPYMDLGERRWSTALENRYEAVVFCAAVTKLADCEGYPEKAKQINVDGTLALATALSRESAYLLLLSTNQVFDGSKPHRKVSEPVCPINEYGRQKAEAEQRILQLPNSAVLRLTKVIHPELPLLRQWEADLKAGKPIEASTNMHLAPIPLEEVVRKIDKLVRNKSTGIHHLSGEKDVSYYEFAASYFRKFNNIEKLIRQSTIRTSQLIISSVPRYTSLRAGK